MVASLRSLRIPGKNAVFTASKITYVGWTECPRCSPIPCCFSSGPSLTLFQGRERKLHPPISAAKEKWVGWERPDTEAPELKQNETGNDTWNAAETRSGPSTEGHGCQKNWVSPSIPLAEALEVSHKDSRVSSDGNTRYLQIVTTDWTPPT